MTLLKMIKAAVAGALWVSAAAPTWAKAPTPEEVGQALDVVEAWLDLVKQPVEAGRARAYLGDHREAFKRVGLSELTRLPARSFETSARAWKKLSREMLRSLKVREALLSSATGRRFSAKLSRQLRDAPQQAQWVANQLCQSYQQMSRDAFEELKEDLIGQGMCWLFERDDDLLIWEDEITTVSMSVTPRGRVEEHIIQWGAQRQSLQPAPPPGMPGVNWLGVRVMTMEEAEVKAIPGIRVVEAVQVAKVYEDGPGEDAGLKEEDVLLTLNGEAIRSSGGLRKMLKELAPGDLATVELWRSGAKKKVEVEVALRPARVR